MSIPNHSALREPSGTTGPTQILWLQPLPDAEPRALAPRQRAELLARLRRSQLLAAGVWRDAAPARLPAPGG